MASTHHSDVSCLIRHVTARARMRMFFILIKPFSEPRLHRVCKLLSLYFINHWFLTRLYTTEIHTHNYTSPSPRVTPLLIRYIHSHGGPHAKRGRCVWLRMLGCEDGWRRKRKLQAGLLLLALSPTSERLFLSTPKHTTTLARPQQCVD